MINGTNNLIAASSTAPKKQSVSSSVNMGSGAFQALLAILLNQTVNFPGNIQNGLSDSPGQDSAMDMGNLSLMNILSKDGVLNSAGSGSFGTAIESILGSAAGSSTLDVQNLLAGKIPSLLDSLKNTGISADDLQELLGKATNSEALNGFPLLADLADGSVGMEDTNITSLLDGISQDSKEIRNKDASTLPDSIMKLLNQLKVPKEADGSFGVTKPEDGKVSLSSAAEALAKTSQDSKNGEAQSVTKDAVLQNLMEQPASNTVEDKKAQYLDQAVKDAKTLSETQVNPAQNAEVKDEDYIIQRPDLLKILRNEGISKAAGSSDGNASGKNGAEKDGSQVEHKETRNDGSNKLPDLAAKVPDKSQALVHGLVQNKEVQADNVHQASTGTEKLAGVSKDDILNQIYDKIKVTNSKDMSELHLNLKPEELGEVSIKLVMEKGMMTGRILVENSHVKDLIESNLSQIKDSLKAQNSNISGFSVSVGLKQDGQQYNQNFSQNRWLRNRSTYSKGNFQEAVTKVVPGVMNMGAVNILA